MNNQKDLEKAIQLLKECIDTYDAQIEISSDYNEVFAGVIKGSWHLTPKRIKDFLETVHASSKS